MVGLAPNVDISVPVGRSTPYTANIRGFPGILGIIRIIATQIFAVQNIDDARLAHLSEFVIRQQQGPTRSLILIAVIESSLSVWGEIVSDSGTVVHGRYAIIQIQFEDRIAIIHGVCVRRYGIECSVTGCDKDSSIRLAGRHVRRKSRTPTPDA